jgi:hypothetical protein
MKDPKPRKKKLQIVIQLPQTGVAPNFVRVDMEARADAITTLIASLSFIVQGLANGQEFPRVKMDFGENYFCEIGVYSA